MNAFDSVQCPSQQSQQKRNQGQSLLQCRGHLSVGLLPVNDGPWATLRFGSQAEINRVHIIRQDRSPSEVNNTTKFSLFRFAVCSPQLGASSTFQLCHLRRSPFQNRNLPRKETENKYVTTSRTQLQPQIKVPAIYRNLSLHVLGLKKFRFTYM